MKIVIGCDKLIKRKVEKKVENREKGAMREKTRRKEKQV